MEVIILIAIAVLFYFIPALVANNRGRAPGPVFMLNLFLGWTLVGWVFALVWAMTERTAKEEKLMNPGPPPPGPAGLARQAQLAEMAANGTAAGIAPAQPAPAAELKVGDRPDFGKTRIRADGDRMGRDEEDENEWGKKIADNLGWRYAIEYTDAKNNVTARVIDVDAIYDHPGEPDFYFTAWCHQAGGRRTFRTDRVQSHAELRGDQTDAPEFEMEDTPGFAQVLRDRLADKPPPEA